ncbi:GNAT family N-acetyltransferase [Verrucomicrobia bacterium LW23]|nr:GNAT family N-acetyltransferase [Verrucomicrobia bacterium LW23]
MSTTSPPASPAAQPPPAAGDITYEHSRPITAAQFADVLGRTTLGIRRPLHDPARLEEMLRHGNLLCTAWHGPRLVGVARSLTDFVFCCYLSDLAVDEAYQRCGIGRGLLRLIQSRLGPEAKLILLAAPGAESYYPHIGFHGRDSYWIESRAALG